ncbi:MAG: radical SAM protein [Nanoarchaeota archaeon]
MGEGIYHPGKLNLIITSVCNSKCTYCLYEKKAQHIAYEDIKKIVNEAKSFNVQTVTITGGEPSLHPDFFRIIDYISEQGMSIGLITNGFNLDDQKMELLMRYPNVFPWFSLDSYDREVNDMLRSKGTYDRVVNMINKIKELDPNKQIGVISIITDKNIGHYPKTIEFLFETLKVDYARADRATILNHSKLERYSKEFNQKFIILSKDIKSKYADKFEPIMYSHSPHCPIFNPSCFEVTVFSDGSIIPCCFLHNSNLKIGTIKDDLKKILSTSRINNIKNTINSNFFKNFDKSLSKNGIFTCVECIEEFNNFKTGNVPINNSPINRFFTKFLSR